MSSFDRSINFRPEPRHFSHDLIFCCRSSSGTRSFAIANIYHIKGNILIESVIHGNCVIVFFYTLQGQDNWIPNQYQSYLLGNSRVFLQRLRNRCEFTYCKDYKLLFRIFPGFSNDKIHRFVPIKILFPMVGIRVNLTLFLGQTVGILLTIVATVYPALLRGSVHRQFFIGSGGSLP